MGELRNVETHEALYYPSTFHALAAVFGQLTGAAPTTAYTVNSVAAAVWLFPVSAATLTWHLLRTRTDQWRAAGAAATAAALSASFTAIPYVEFDTASMPNLAAYGVAVPTMVLVVSALRHRDRIPLAVLALLGVFSVHITGGVVTVMFVVAWWLFDALWHPVRGRIADLRHPAARRACRPCLLLPQFLGVLQQAEIIVGHAFVTHEGKKRGADRRGRAAHPSPQRLPDPVGADHPGRGRRGHPAGAAGLVAAGGLAAAGGVDRALVGAVRRPDRRAHRQVQRPVLQRSAAALGGGDDAARRRGRDRGVHARSAVGRPRRAG